MIENKLMLGWFDCAHAKQVHSLAMVIHQYDPSSTSQAESAEDIALRESVMSFAGNSDFLPERIQRCETLEQAVNYSPAPNKSSQFADSVLAEFVPLLSDLEG